MEKNFLSSITKNKHIKEIITELNLNEDQILSAYPYFMNIIDENKNIEKYEYITKIKIYDDKNVIAISVINNNANIEIKSKRLNWLYYLSNMNYNLRWDNPKESDENKFDENIFYWKNKKLKNFDRKKIALWTVSFTKKFLSKYLIKSSPSIDLNSKLNSATIAKSISKEQQICNLDDNDWKLLFSSLIIKIPIFCLSFLIEWA